MMYRTTALVAFLALGATANAFAQSTPPANSTMTPSSSSSPQTPNDSVSNSSASKATSSQDPKMKACMSAEKGKNSGLSDEQVKQKCMLQIASHQGQGK